MSENDYLEWFSNALHECFTSVSEGCPAIFYQTDRLFKGKRISKCNLLMTAAESCNQQIVWHKICLRRDPGKIDIRRPGYSHLICFGDDKVTAGKATADVIEKGNTLYPNGMNITAATIALLTALRHTGKVVDPFCGRGTVPALAEAYGFESIIGIDIDPQQAEAARATRLHKGGKVKNKKNLLFEERN